MYIVAIAWIYVVFMMAITEQTATAGVMTFLLYGVLPLTIVLYLMGIPQRKRNRQRAEQKRMSGQPDTVDEVNEEAPDTKFDPAQEQAQKPTDGSVEK
jgi:small-conductance mechanosensitive channel